MDTQHATIVPMVSGPISVIASSTIIIMILRSKKKLSNIYHRLLFGMSVADIIVSLAISFSSLPSPKDTSPQVWKAYGNNSTCQAQGFLYLFGASVEPIYNCSLQFYYLCMIKYVMKTEDIQNKIEPFLHTIPILFGSTAAVYSLITGSINASESWCWIQSYPFQCHKTSEVECIRGENAYVLRWIFQGGPYIFVFLFMGVAMAMIYHAVWKRENAMARHSFTPSANPPLRQVGRSLSVSSSMIAEDNSSSAASSTIPSPESGRKNFSFFHPRKIKTNASSMSTKRHSATSIEISQRVNTRKTLTRVSQYYLAYLLAYLIPITATVIAQYGSKILVLEILSFLLYPLQGLFNFVVFILPDFSKVRQRNEGISLLRALLITVQTYGREKRPQGEGSKVYTTKPFSRRVGERGSLSSHVTADAPKRGKGHIENIDKISEDFEEESVVEGELNKTSISDPSSSLPDIEENAHFKREDPNIDQSTRRRFSKRLSQVSELSDPSTNNENVGNEENFEEFNVNP